ncbi:MAG: flagellar hook-associated protein FlgL [Planctomycetota bacterium]
MAVSPVNISRVSQGLRTNFVLDALRRNQRDLFLSESQISSGRSFVVPSEDPARAARSLDLSEALLRQQQFAANAMHGDNFLSAADSALSDINALLVEASTIASQMVGSLSSREEREAEAEIIGSMRRQLIMVGNREFNGRYLFGGRDTLTRPFVDGVGGILYQGDVGEMFTRLSEDLSTAVNVPGSELFGALSDPITTEVDLTPILTDGTRLDDVTGANGQAVPRGTLVFNEVGGAGVFTVDLSTVDTIGDVVEAINAAAGQAGANVTASLSDTGISVEPGGDAVSITDLSNGAIASGLGLLTPTPSSTTIEGRALTARVTRLTPVEALAAGAGIDLESGFIITNGTLSATIDIAEATTVQDIINTINNAGVNVLARINESGTGIDVFNQASGTSLAIGENDGTTATDLGIRTMNTATPLSSLNFGDGVGNLSGQTDLQIMAKDGKSFEVNLDGAATIGDVIDLINAAATAATVAVEAAFATTGNGIRIEDKTGGTGTLRVALANLSTAGIDLGLHPQTAGGTAVELLGNDVNPTRTEGIIGALTDLENALRGDDTPGIASAGDRLDGLRQEVTRIHGIIGARAQTMTAKRQQLEDAALTTKAFLSQVQDLDFAEATTRLQGAMTRLQATLQTSTLVSNLSLLDFLR